MALALRYAVRSDVGLLREGNEDSAYAGPHLLAVADGMGGYAAGEVASSAVITAIAGLDLQDVPEQDLGAALAAAVTTAKHALRDIVDSDPAVGSMGTTLTAMLMSGGTIALGHIGDSRAYLLRDSDLYQITKDHTFVQALVDQGRITPEEVATHPQRSLLLRALDGRSDADPDISVLAAEAGDRYLLCSDGLPVAVTDEQLVDALTTISEPEDLVLRLIDLAIAGGGPDNITCIVADVIDTETTSARPTQAAIAAGAASAGPGTGSGPVTQPARPVTQPVRQPTQPGQLPAARLSGQREVTQVSSTPTPTATRPGHVLAPPAGDTAPGRRYAVTSDAIPDLGDDALQPASHRRWPVVTSVLVILALLVAGSLFVGYRYVRSQYYVGEDRGNVAIYRGIHQRLLGVSLYSVSERTAIPVAGLPSSDAQVVTRTSAPGGLAQAKALVTRIRHDHDCMLAYAAVRTWIEHKPRPVKRQEKVHGKLKTVIVTPHYRPEPSIPKSCPTEPLPPS